MRKATPAREKKIENRRKPRVRMSAATRRALFDTHSNALLR